MSLLRLSSATLLLRVVLKTLLFISWPGLAGKKGSTKLKTICTNGFTIYMDSNSLPILCGWICRQPRIIYKGTVMDSAVSKVWAGTSYTIDCS